MAMRPGILIGRGAPTKTKGIGTLRSTVGNTAGITTLVSVRCPIELDATGNSSVQSAKFSPQYHGYDYPICSPIPYEVTHFQSLLKWTRPATVASNLQNSYPKRLLP
jgi:hypothetical protein